MLPLSVFHNIVTLILSASQNFRISVYRRRPPEAHKRYKVVLVTGGPGGGRARARPPVQQHHAISVERTHSSGLGEAAGAGAAWRTQAGPRPSAPLAAPPAFPARPRQPRGPQRACDSAARPPAQPGRPAPPASPVEVIDHTEQNQGVDHHLLHRQFRHHDTPRPPGPAPSDPRNTGKRWIYRRFSKPRSSLSGSVGAAQPSSAPRVLRAARPHCH